MTWKLSIYLMVMSVGIPAFAIDRFVSPAGNNTSPFDSWETAALDIQSAIFESLPGDIIWVDAGIYDLDDNLNVDGISRILIDKAVTVISAFGPVQTIIKGNNASEASSMRCAWIGSGARLSGFTLIDGGAFTTYGSSGRGGGAYVAAGGQLDNCIIRSCQAVLGGGVAGEHEGSVSNCLIEYNSASADGGGVFKVTVSHSVIQFNNAAQGGGGISSANASHCMIRGNYADRGGGVRGSDEYSGWITIKNCVITDNSVSTIGGGASGDITAINCTFSQNHLNNKGEEANEMVLYNCLIWNNHLNTGAIMWGCDLSNCVHTNSPTVFRDRLGGDFRLHPASPAINISSNAWLTSEDLTGADISGRPRLVNGIVDAGAHEFQGSTDGYVPASWLNSYLLPTNQVANFLDPDGDGFSTWQEFVTGTIPTNGLNYFFLTAHSTSHMISWNTLTNRQYTLYQTQNLMDAPIQPTIAFAPTNEGVMFYPVGTNYPASSYMIGVDIFSP